MLFNSQLFLLVFLPAALVVQWIVADHWRWWIASLLVHVGDVLFLLESAAAAAAGRLPSCSTGGPRSSSAAPATWLGSPRASSPISRFSAPSSISTSFSAASRRSPGFAYRPLAIALPLGISFFSFQQIGYLVDLRRGVAKPHPLVRYALYVSFFPHLIAGPLLRHSEFFASLDQRRPREETTRLYGQGLALMVLGLMKKVLIADNLGFAVNQFFGHAAAGPLSFAEGWLAALGFALQIYFDFSGYSDIAIGLGSCSASSSPTISTRRIAPPA